MDGEPVELFDVEADPGETTNLLGKHPAMVKELTAELKAFLAAPRAGWQRSTD